MNLKQKFIFKFIGKYITFSSNFLKYQVGILIVPEALRASGTPSALRNQRFHKERDSVESQERGCRMCINEKVLDFVRSKGVYIIEFVDISVLPNTIRRGYCNAILIGTPLSKNYLQSLSSDRDVDYSEFTQKEAFIDRLAESLAEFLASKGYHSYAQSESNIANDGLYDANTCTSALPHKTIALLAGIGWIGKDDLLVTHKYGSGFCMCTVLTDAPIFPEKRMIVTSQCGTCEICKVICPEQAISGKNWEIGCSRESLVDINLCKRCLKCFALCIWTRHYAQNS